MIMVTIEVKIWLQICWPTHYFDFLNIMNKYYQLSKRNYHASILQQYYHREKCFLLSAIKTSSFFPLKRTCSKRSRLSRRSLHTLQSFGYHHYDWVTFLYFLTIVKLITIKVLMNKAFSTPRFCERRRRVYRWQIVFTLPFLDRKSVNGLSLCKCICSHKLAQTLSSSGKDPKCESVKTSDYVVGLYNK